jgi:hypothetical protein
MSLQRAETVWGQRRSVPQALHRVVIDDHARLPWRFFGRLTAAVRASLRG